MPPKLKPKPPAPCVAIAQALKARGYDVIPLHQKDRPPTGWPEMANTPEDISGWRERALAIRMHGSGDTLVVDLDIQRQDVLDQILERYGAQWPGFMQGCVARHSGGVKVALFGRMTTIRRHMHSGRWGVCAEHPGGNRVELFTSNDRRYVVAWGRHSPGREYGYDGPELWTVAQADLPELAESDLNALLTIPDQVMAEMGLMLADPPEAGHDNEEVAFDLEPGMMAELKDGRQASLEEVEEIAAEGFVYLHGRLFDPGSDSFRIKAKVTSRGLTLWDFGDDGRVHLWKHLGPQPEVLSALLKGLADAHVAAGGAADGTGEGSKFGAPPPPRPDDEAPVMLPGSITQHGTALVFAVQWAATMKYCHNTGKWYDWTGAYWKPEDTKLAFARSRVICREVSENSGRTEFKEVRKRGFIGAVEGIAQTDRRIAVTADRWDRDPYLLGTPDGTLDLRTGRLRAADAVDGITRLAAIAPARTAFAPRWMAFLSETFGGDVGLIRFVQLWFGYCLTGDIREHALWFGFGEGGNGKGVLINTMRGILGDYAVAAAMDTFVAAKHDRHLTELAMLKGARIVTASETERGRAWAESRIKQITGGDPITARFMRQDHFTFQPEFKLTLIGNHKPVLRGVDDAVRRRFNLVPFLFKPAVVDKQLEEKLRAEWPGILAWMVEGCLAWQAGGLIRPDSVRIATESYFEDQDLTGQWLEDCCEVRHGSTIFETTAALFASWKHHAEQAGEYPGTRKTFSTELARRGFELFKQGHGNVRSVRGIRLKTSPLAKAVLLVVPNDLNKKQEDET